MYDGSSHLKTQLKALIQPLTLLLSIQTHITALTLHERDLKCPEVSNLSIITTYLLAEFTNSSVGSVCFQMPIQSPRSTNYYFCIIMINSDF